MARKLRAAYRAFTVAILCAPQAKADYVDKFDVCRARVHGILENGETFGDITNVTIWEYGHIFTGDIDGLVPPYSRHDILALTYKGKSSPGIITFSMLLLTLATIKAVSLCAALTPSSQNLAPPSPWSLTGFFPSPLPSVCPMRPCTGRGFRGPWLPS